MVQRLDSRCQKDIYPRLLHADKNGHMAAALRPLTTIKYMAATVSCGHNIYWPRLPAIAVQSIAAVAPTAANSTLWPRP
ncbi:hypothetical protein Taro_054445 [Colocasia esculenta]|uniref:Uncharacterized protein n=1 Tax=Colocasia esculenta TaxID=4460 RepID=A0A843XQF9_COLES|nr:hypothetical protein [Colocasia esculenta]